MDRKTAKVVIGVTFVVYAMTALALWAVRYW